MRLAAGTKADGVVSNKLGGVIPYVPPGARMAYDRSSWPYSQSDAVYDFFTLPYNHPYRRRRKLIYPH